jgi:hypothetical protein
VIVIAIEKDDYENLKDFQGSLLKMRQHFHAYDPDRSDRD